MRINLVVKRIDDNDPKQGWRVQIVDPDTGDTPINPQTTAQFEPAVRLLRCVGSEKDENGIFPLPPADEVPVAPDKSQEENLDEQILLNATDTKLLSSIYGNIINRQPDNKNRNNNRNDMARFGRYLFATLIGEQWWKQTNALKGRRELTLTFNPKDSAMNRLPWEMMHSDGEGEKDYFLSGFPLVSISRYVAGVGHTVAEIESPPRLLVVVGSKLTGEFADAIRPGAEYLGLLRSLRYNKLSLKHHLLLEATPDKLAAAVQDFRPTIVHFICHGKIKNNGEGVLMLLNNDNSDKSEEMSADAIFNKLVYEKEAVSPDAEKGLAWPQIVVLNACYTASVANQLFQDLSLLEAGQVATPFAVQLISRGIPIVVGMGGRIADQACRLFTRRLYLSLLDDGDLVYAAANGRRAGILGNGASPYTTVDWALPVLFMSEGVRQPKLKINMRTAEQRWHEAGSAYELPDFPAFCGRLDIFQINDLLMADATTLRTVMKQESDFRIVAVAIREADEKRPEGARYGRSRLLRELAAKAAHDVHVPCLVNKEALNGTGKRWPPKNFPDFLLALGRAALITATNLKVPPPSWKWLDMLRQLKKGDELAEDAHSDIKSSYFDKNPEDPVVIGIAIRLDLLDFLDRIRQELPESERARCKLLLLIDDVHQMNIAAESVLNGLLGKLGVQASDIRVIFTHADVPATGQKIAVGAITDWFGSNNCKRVWLDKFEQPVDSRLAYENFLFNWQDSAGATAKRVRLVPRIDKDGEEAVASFFIQLAEFVQDIPSYLNNREVATLIKGTLKSPLKQLREADDEDKLKSIKY